MPGVHPPGWRRGASVPPLTKEEKLPFVLWSEEEAHGAGDTPQLSEKCLAVRLPLHRGAVQVGAPRTAAPNFACVAVVWGQTIALFAELAPYMDIFWTKALCSDLSRHSGCVCPNQVTAG